LSKKKKKVSKDDMAQLRQPWIKKRSGLLIMGIVSIGFAIWVGYQIALQGSFWDGVLWGLIFGGSIWLVYFGMNFFHSFFNRDRKSK
jgi:hypothetical protein